jgi:hypothetical protein
LRSATTLTALVPAAKRAASAAAPPEQKAGVPIKIKVGAENTKNHPPDAKNVEEQSNVIDAKQKRI